MRLEHVCNIDLAYQQESACSGKFVMIEPHSSGGHTRSSDGNGAVVGERLCGRVRWVKYPSRQHSQTPLPEVYGLIQTDDGAPIMFTVQARPVAPEQEAERHTLTATFEADDARYRWFNNTFCILEGTIDLSVSVIRGQIYACVHERA